MPLPGGERVGGQEGWPQAWKGRQEPGELPPATEWDECPGLCLTGPLGSPCPTWWPWGQVHPSRSPRPSPFPSHSSCLSSASPHTKPYGSPPGHSGHGRACHWGAHSPTLSTESWPQVPELGQGEFSLWPVAWRSWAVLQGPVFVSAAAAANIPKSDKISLGPTCRQRSPQHSGLVSSCWETLVLMSPRCQSLCACTVLVLGRSTFSS